VAIDVHGSEDQEKDASTAEHERHVSVFLVSGACASKSACGRNVPFLSALWTPAVAGASPRGVETRSRRRTEPRPTFRRRPAKDDAIP